MEREINIRKWTKPTIKVFKLKSFKGGALTNTEGYDMNPGDVAS